MPIIYHIALKEDWSKAQQTGFYEHPSLKEEGFIHCSEERQVEDVLQRFFQGKKELLKLVIDTDKLTSQYVQEWSPSMLDTYPHIYGPINTSAVLRAEPI